jgi:hypothetical protein
MAQRVSPLPIVPPTITINPDGSHQPASGVSIGNQGEVRFVINFPPGTVHCTIPFGQVTFQSANQARAAGHVLDPNSPGGTIKIGS